MRLNLKSYSTTTGSSSRALVPSVYASIHPTSSHSSSSPVESKWSPSTSSDVVPEWWWMSSCFLAPQAGSWNQKATVAQAILQATGQHALVMHLTCLLSFSLVIYPAATRNGWPQGFQTFRQGSIAHPEPRKKKHLGPIPGGGRGGGRTKGGEYKRKMKTARTMNPNFGREVFKFESVRTITEEFTSVGYVVTNSCGTILSSPKLTWFFSSIEVRDGDNLAAWACFRLDRLQTELRTICLYDANRARSKGLLLVRIGRTVSSIK